MNKKQIPIGIPQRSAPVESHAARALLASNAETTCRRYPVDATAWQRTGETMLYRHVNEKRSVIELLCKLRSNPSNETDIMIATIAAAGIALSSAVRGSLSVRYSGDAEWLNEEIELLSVQFNQSTGKHRRALENSIAATIDKLVANRLISIKQVSASRIAKASSEKPPEEKPLRVEVVAMPTRETTSAIVRDSSGNIVSTTQVERDAA